MMAKVREALFSLLQPLPLSLSSSSSDAPTRALDLFCGSGAVGLEALSRGICAHVTFVDASPECAAYLQRTLQRLEEEKACAGRFARSHARVRVMRAEEYLRAAPDGVMHLITLTPPYEEVHYSELMQSVARSAAVDDGTLIVVEYPVELGTLPPRMGDGRLIGVRNRRYGRTMLALYVCCGGGAGATVHEPMAAHVRSEEFDRLMSRRHGARELRRRQRRQQRQQQKEADEGEAG